MQNHSLILPSLQAHMILRLKSAIQVYTYKGSEPSIDTVTVSRLPSSPRLASNKEADDSP
jgi:hypothetical protein